MEIVRIVSVKSSFRFGFFFCRKYCGEFVLHEKEHKRSIKCTCAMYKIIVFSLAFLSIGLTINGYEFLFNDHFVPCPNPEDFRCISGSLCIKADLECDGKKDCPDGSDEIEAECGM